MLYQTENHRTRIEVRLENETVWLMQKLMAELFQKVVIADSLRSPTIRWGKTRRGHGQAQRVKSRPRRSRP
jgi:hypothetical protein